MARDGAGWRGAGAEPFGGERAARYPPAYEHACSTQSAAHACAVPADAAGAGEHARVHAAGRCGDVRDSTRGLGRVGCCVCSLDDLVQIQRDSEDAYFGVACRATPTPLGPLGGVKCNYYPLPLKRLINALTCGTLPFDRQGP